MADDSDILLLLGRAPLMLPMFALVLFRVGGLMMTAPIYGSETVPARIRAALAAAIALAVFPAVAPKLPQNLSLGAVLTGAFGELAIGLIIGLSLSLLFVGIQVAGMVVGQQAGMALGRVFNPVLNASTSVIEQLFFFVALTVFLLIGGHREMMRALLQTFEVIPVMSFEFDMPVLNLLVDLLTSAYAVALRLAAPVLISMLIATLSLGFLSRTMPQLNILSVGFVVRVMLAMTLGGFALAAAEGVLTGSVYAAFERIGDVLGVL